MKKRKRRLLCLAASLVLTTNILTSVPYVYAGQNDILPYRLLSDSGTGQPEESAFEIRVGKSSAAENYLGETITVSVAIAKNTGVSALELHIKISNLELAKAVTANYSLSAAAKQDEILKNWVMTDQGDGSSDLKCNDEGEFVLAMTGSTSDYIGGLVDLTFLVPRSVVSLQNAETDIVVEAKNVTNITSSDASGTPQITSVVVTGDPQSQKVEQLKIVEPSKNMDGDVNGDGEVDLMDASLLWQHFNGMTKLSEAQISRGHVHKYLKNQGPESSENDVSLLDVIAIIKRVSLKKTAWPQSPEEWNK